MSEATGLRHWLRGVYLEASLADTCLDVLEAQRPDPRGRAQADLPPPAVLMSHRRRSPVTQLLHFQHTRSVMGVGPGMLSRGGASRKQLRA